jgi:hypothetical protein
MGFTCETDHFVELRGSEQIDKPPDDIMSRDLASEIATAYILRGF